MAHYAELDNDNKVVFVHYYDNQFMLDENNNENDEIALNTIKEILNIRGQSNPRLIKCSYNRKIRYNYPAVGFTYDEENDAFIPPKPYKGWILNTNTFNWEPPTPRPDPNKPYYWNNDQENWVLLELPDS